MAVSLSGYSIRLDFQLRPSWNFQSLHDFRSALVDDESVSAVEVDRHFTDQVLRPAGLTTMVTVVIKSSHRPAWRLCGRGWRLGRSLVGYAASVGVLETQTHAGHKLAILSHMQLKEQERRRTAGPLPGPVKSR